MILVFCPINLLKNTFKVALLQYHFNVFYTVNTVSYFKLKIDPKMCTFKNLEKICQKHLATLIFVTVYKFLSFVK